MKHSKRIKLFLNFYLWILIILIALIFLEAFSQASNYVNWLLAIFLGKFQSDIEVSSHYLTLILSFLISLLPGIYFLKISFKKAPKLTLLTAWLIFMGVFLVALIFKILIPIFYLELSLLIGVAAAIILKMVYASSEQEFLRLAFTQFVSQEKLKELLKDPENLRLEGKETLITILFMDIRGFTAFSEKNPAAYVVNRLNDLLDKATEIIISHDGVVDKYIGDGMMAVWGAPYPDKRQVQKACNAALAIRQKIIKESEFEVGIGIHHGVAIVGNMGSRKRFDYTAIGDTVNTAARLETATKDVGFPIILSQEVLAVLKKEKAGLSTKDLGTIKVKGKRNGLHIYGLVGIRR